MIIVTCGLGTVDATGTYYYYNIIMCPRNVYFFGRLKVFGRICRKGFSVYYNIICSLFKEHIYLYTCAKRGKIINKRVSSKTPNECRVGD